MLDPKKLMPEQPTSRAWIMTIGQADLKLLLETAVQNNPELYYVATRCDRVLGQDLYSQECLLRLLALLLTQNKDLSDQVTQLSDAILSTASITDVLKQIEEEATKKPDR